MVEDLFALFKIKPTCDLDIMRENQSLTGISTRALTGLERVLSDYNPDIVLVQGDTTTAFIGALAAFYQKKPVGHVEAGLRSYDKFHPYPEEINRRLISVVGDLHFVPTRASRKNLENEGVPAEKIFVTGNTVIDALLDVVHHKTEAFDGYLPSAVFSHEKRMILVTAHRRENWGEPLKELCVTLKNLVHAFSDVSIVYPVHLNPNVRKTVFDILSEQDRIHLLEPLPYGAFVSAMNRAHLIITDSGGIQEEAPSLKKPVLVFRKVTERPEGVETGGVKIVGQDAKKVFSETSRLLQDQGAYENMSAGYNPYGDGFAARRIMQAILYYFKKGKRPEDLEIGETGT
jgi:UDP-N-acetylglucosamine 2-epimerase (non-hydrolysing)